CANPLGQIGQAGVISQGNSVSVQGGTGTGGAVPQFANTGTTDYRYYLVARHPTFGAANPLYAGKALSNGTGNITVTAPDIAGANSFDLLRVTPVPNFREQAPFGTGNYAVATNVLRSSACSTGVCTFTDTQAALQSYTVAIPSYFPPLNFSTLGTGPGHIITLSDSNFQKTIATANNRPANDANDAYVGYDQGDGNPANIGITLGAPKSVSQYIANAGDGANWLERLSAN